MFHHLRTRLILWLTDNYLWQNFKQYIFFMHLIVIICIIKPHSFHSEFEVVVYEILTSGTFSICILY